MSASWEVNAELREAEYRSKEATLLCIRDEMASFNAGRQGHYSTLDNINALLEEIGLDA